MKIHLTHEAATGLIELVKYLHDKYPPENKADKIIYSLVDQVRIKIRNRIEKLYSQSGYTFTLSIEHSLAFDLWMERMGPSIPGVQFIYERNIALQVTNQIDYTYG